MAALMKPLVMLMLLSASCAVAQKLTFHTVTIANGAAVSSSINTKDEPIVTLDMPAAWTAADIVIEGSNDGSTWKGVYNADGSRYTISVAASRMVIILSLEIQGIRYIRLRSVDSLVADVNQGAARSIMLITRRIP
jgi:hypothetical protein